MNRNNVFYFLVWMAAFYGTYRLIDAYDLSRYLMIVVLAGGLALFFWINRDKK